MTRVIVRDEIALAQPVALKFRDASDLSLITDGLTVSLTPLIPVGGRALRSAPQVLKPVASGIWTAPRLLGVSGGIPGSSRGYVVEVSDDQNRFLPVSTRIDIVVPPEGRLPKPGEISPWTGWDGLGARADAIKPKSPAPPAAPDYIPLFPQIARNAAAPRAEVRAHIALGENMFARWSVVTVAIEGTILGIGIADERGAVSVAFPYPAPPSMTPQASAAGRQSISWPIAVKVHFSDLAQNAAGGFAAEQRDLAAILAQLKSPARAMLAQLDLPDPAAAQTLTLGQPLILRSKGSDGSPSPYLYLKTP